ncbi:hypothetical protein [Microvirga rosea]|uniref:hypothetical protein n=1 Tax=Microvirga rosea TaxID=2715425 RepID=UPI001D0A4F88|nr:hypothetical protein [Microvirga rosea]MCB8823500.1 hypothetical protein [Microvirga rosea]
MHVALEQIQTHRRVALGYLQTGNAELALVEMERFRDLLKSDSSGQTWTEPDALAALARARAAVVQGIKAAEIGDLDRAGALVAEASRDLDAWRQDAGFALFSDCIVKASRTYEALDIYRTSRPDLAEPSVRRHILEAAVATERALARCNSEAPPEVRTEPEFRRLVDGFTASLRLVAEATEKQDKDYLYRLLIEQRAFDRLLAFRFG